MPKSNLSRRTSKARQMASIRMDESFEEREARLLQVRTSAANRRISEVSPVREMRLLLRGIQTSSQRQRESTAERLHRLDDQRVRSMQNRRRAPTSRLAFEYQPNFDYINSVDIQIGAMNKICNHCCAKKWKDEAPGMCCAGGKISLLQLDVPPEPLKELILGFHPLSKHFLDNARKYNTLFQMTSFGATQVVEENFMPTFKIQGQVYHSIGSLIPAPNENHQFLQIYFVSDADQLSLRSNIVPNLKRELIETLQNVLKHNNNLIMSFKYNLENMPSGSRDDFKLIIHSDRVPANQHRGRYNAPIVNEVAVLLVDEDKGPRDIVLRCRDNQIKRVSELHRSYDPLQYPLMFPRGENGYYLTIQQSNPNNRQNKTVSCMQFYAYRLMIRTNTENYLHYFKNLFNQYCVDMMAKMITERLNYIRHNQKKLRSDEYIHLQDAINQDANIEAANIGQRVILPSSFTGSPRYMHEKTQDAMTYVRKHGRPDLFITFTCNPQWPEIKNELFPGQKSSDRHDIISRVFQLKLKKLMDQITKKEIFGKVNCYAYTVEWQKRGLPHAHILIWLEIKIQPDEIDLIISAELPNKDGDPLLFEIVCKNMIHGPCGDLNASSTCMKDCKCTKKYPRSFISETHTGDDGYPTYRRRSPEDGGQIATMNIRGTAIDVDNRWVVPYSSYLLRTFNAHINVEFCNSVQAIKYICKYINKGPDSATFSLKNDVDEVNHYVNGRYICTSEATWRFFDFPIHGRFPTVVHLAAHLENNQRVYFTEENLHDVLQNPRKTTLTAFFNLCQSDDFAKTLLYHEVPSYYTWSNNQFSRRKRGLDVEGFPGIKKDSALGRVYTIHPNQNECFHLRMLLHHVRGPTSFKSLKTVNGVIYPTFQAACGALGLLENDDHWKDTLADASISQTPSRLRDLFAIILVFCHPSQPTVLWESFKKDFCEDILYQAKCRTNDDSITYSEEIFNRGLIEIEDKVVSLGEKYLCDFGLPTPIRDEQDNENPYDTMFRNSFNTDELEEYININLPRLVPDQRQAYDSITQNVNSDRKKVFFLDAPGGTGKTFLINLLLAYVRSTGSLALGVASSGIAATLLTGGRTAHTTFKLPLNVSCGQESVCSIRKNGPLGKIFKDTKLIVWDECTMIHRAHVEAIDRTLRDIRSCDKLMGGITFVFAGDFRQTLPVIPKGTRADIIKACLKLSPIWRSVSNLNLRTNMRVHLGGGDAEFPSQLLSVGNGTIPHDHGYVSIDAKLGKIVQTIDALISEVYPNVDELLQKPYHWLCERAIITPRNISAFEINNIILGHVRGENKEYRSIDTVVNTEDAVHYPQEFLNSLNPAGFPPHSLQLKVGVPIILLRNLNPPKLCNGTRLQIKAMRNNVIEATVLTGPAAGEIALIPRIPMIPTDLPFQFKRLQFPIKVSFTITINKAQGQTFKYVGIDLRSDCFSHGQLYVGLSRTGKSENQFILLPYGTQKTKNVVYSEVL